MNIRPILNKIIVKPQDVDKTTSGGIIIANAKNEGVIQGEIVAVGPGSHDNKGNFIPVKVEVGNVVLFTAGAGQKFEHEKQEYNTITESEIIAVLS